MTNDCICSNVPRIWRLAGVTRTVRLTVTKDGSPYDFTGLQTVLRIDRDNSDFHYEPQFTVEGDDNNIIVFTWSADKQPLGDYTIEVTVTDGSGNKDRVNWHGATGVRLVEYSNLVKGEDAAGVESDSELGLDGIFTMNGVGMDAYEEWLADGNEGSLHDYILWMQGPAREAAEAAETTMTEIQSRADDDHTTAGSDHTRAAADHTTATGDHTRAEEDHTRAISDHTRAAQDHTSAVGDHMTAGQDHLRAEADHTTASTDHTRAESDHSTAASDHTTAASDHTKAGQDSTRAGNDHDIAVADHAQAEADHTRAEGDHTTAAADHTTAAADHTQAASDHTTAAADHTQAVADHAVMAGYDTRLTNVETDVTQLGQKVDDISTGKYYGYFAKEEDLPEEDVDGFAYVGEGPTYTIYNLHGGVWTSSDITVNQSPIGNDEDIDQNENGKLQFANRVYNAQQPNGMGYKILRKDATFASQVTDTNTIYEIRYQFDLNNAAVTVPSGSVLRFNGGKLSNGTLSGAFKIEAPMEKIFSSINFSGGCIFNEFFLEWFTDKGTDSVDATVVNDASTDLNTMFASGIKRVFLTNQKYYYLASTVTIPGDVTISGENQTLDRAANYGNGITPCFYVSGDTVAFIINCNQSASERRSVEIKGMHIWRIWPSITEGNFKENIPTVLMDVNQQLWGCTLELFISSALAPVEMTVKDDTIKTVSQSGYTGLEVYVHGTGNYLTYANFGGFFRNLRRGIYIHSDNLTWITGVTLSFDSICVFGGVVTSAKIYGKHQALFHLVNYKGLSYFNGSGELKFYGETFDLNHLNTTTQLGSVEFALKSGGKLNLDPSAQVTADFKGTNILPYEYFIPQNNYPSGIANLGLDNNILEDLFYNNYGPIGGDKFVSRNKLTAINTFRGASYVELNNTIVAITKDNITNYDKLFKAKSTFATNSDIKSYLDSCGCYTPTHAKELVATFSAATVIGSPIFGAVTRDVCSFVITIKDASDVSLFQTTIPKSLIGGYANYMAFFVPFVILYSYVIEIRCICETSTGYFTQDELPKLFLLNAKGNNAITTSGGVVGGNLRMANAEFFNLAQMAAGYRLQCNRFVAGEYLLEGVNAVSNEKQILHAIVYSFDARYIHIKCLSSSGCHYIHINEPTGEYRTDFGSDVLLGVYYNYASYRAEFVVTYKGPDVVAVIDVIGSGPTKLLSRDADITGFTAATLVTQ